MVIVVVVVAVVMCGDCSSRYILYFSNKWDKDFCSKCSCSSSNDGCYDIRCVNSSNDL